MKRTGILAGTFDPVHQGHLKFALKAIEAANLDNVYFLPEIAPRRKTGVTHIGHRIAMLERAVKPYQNLHVLELPDKQFSIVKTWPRIIKRFPKTELFLLIGADEELSNLSKWPMIGVLLETAGLIVAQKRVAREETERVIKTLPQSPRSLYLLQTSLPKVSSERIRKDIRAGKKPEGALASSLKYADKNWLYVDVSSKAS